MGTAFLALVASFHFQGKGLEILKTKERDEIGINFHKEPNCTEG